MTELLAFLASVHPLPDTLKERLQEIIKEKELARKELLVRSGRICGHLYFIKAGLVRCFYCQDDQDISAWFAGEGHICTVMESFVRQQYSRENIHALEDSIVQAISHEDMEGLYRDFPVMNIAARILIQRCYLLQNRRIIGMWMQNAARRLEWFQKNFPGMSRRVPGKYLASYLGMTASKLSRLKKIEN